MLHMSPGPPTLSCVRLMCAQSRSTASVQVRKRLRERGLCVASQNSCSPSNNQALPSARDGMNPGQAGNPAFAALPS